MTADIQRHEANRAGRDFAVGDIHGHFTRLRQTLQALGFDPARDRLFSVGDLVDRGPQSEQALDWLAQPWFYAVQGNHEDYAVRHYQRGLVDVDNYRYYGGGWFLDLPRERQRPYAEAFASLPLAREIETALGLVVVVHADSPSRTWHAVERTLRDHRRRARSRAQWSRERLSSGDESGVAGVRAVVVGHTPVARPVVLGNVHHIDTAGWTEEGYFTVLDLATLAPAPLPSIPLA